MRTWAAVFAVAVLCAACDQGDNTPPSEPAPPRLAHHDSVVLERPHGCESPVDECGGVEIRFPVFEQISNNAAYLLNRKVREFYVDQLGGSGSTPTNPLDTTREPLPSIIDAARLLLAEFVEFKNEFPMASAVWTVEGNATVLANDSLVCVQLDAYSFLGGAHPSTSTAFVTVNARTGREIDPRTLIRNMKAFTDSAEKAFREVNDMSASEDFGSRGYWFKADQFLLPDNIGFTADSLILHYNAYDIAPYAMGPTRITMPRSALAVQ
jgi:hypothetical protein